jgi:hypothetical protein
MRYNAGSNARGCSADSPAPGPPCTTTTGLPVGFPDCCQYMQCPSPTSSIPETVTGLGGNRDLTVSQYVRDRHSGFDRHVLDFAKDHDVAGEEPSVEQSVSVETRTSAHKPGEG